MTTAQVVVAWASLSDSIVPCLSPTPARFSHFLLLNDFPPPSRSLEQAKVVETSATVDNNSPIQEYVHSDDHTQPTYY